MRNFLRHLMFWKRKRQLGAETYINFEFPEKFLESLERDPENITSQELIENSITATYQDEKWLESRILMDGIQNHLPSDSGGDWFGIQVKVGDRWHSHDYLEGVKNREVEAIRFFDNGDGFMSDELRVFSSSKATDKSSRGQFGEGLKMISAAALRLGMRVAIDSRNWRAEPVFRKLQLTDREEKQLVFNVSHYENSIEGSVTTFYEPTQAFIDTIRRVGSFVLPALGDSYKPLFCTPYGDLIGKSDRNYIKGLYFPSPDVRSIFSYNLFAVDDRSVNRDRDQINYEEFKDNVARILAEMTEEELVRGICEAGLKARSFSHIAEIDALYEGARFSGLMPSSVRKIYRKTIEDMFDSENIMITNDTVFSKTKKALEKQGIQLLVVDNYYFFKFLLSCGFKEVSRKDLEKAREKDEENTKITTSFTAEYAPDNWNEERILIDAVQNHMESDSGGSGYSVSVRIGEKWIPIEEYKPSGGMIRGVLGIPKINALKIEDDGKGYAKELLGLAYSSKKREQTRGMHGEGLKMLAVAVLRLGMKISFVSRDWHAMAFLHKVDVENEKVHQLRFEMIEPKETREGSATIISGITPAFAREIESLSEKVLTLSGDYSPLARTKSGDIVEKDKGIIYVKDLKVTDKEKKALIFSYNFSDNSGFEARDRDIFSFSVLIAKVRSVIEKVKDRRVIEYLLQYAAKYTDRHMLEYQEYSLPRAQKKIWRKSFLSVFGERAVLATHPRAAVHAESLGYDVIFMPDGTRKTLISCKVPKDVDILGDEDFETVPIEELTEKEREIFYTHEYLDDILGVNAIQKHAHIKIFDAVYDKNGIKRKNLLGAWRDKENTIYINRTQLRDEITFASTFIHERGHQLSGAGDFTYEFVNFFTDTLAEYTLARRKEKQKV